MATSSSGPGPESASASPALGSAVLRGSAWMFLNTVVTRLVSLLATIVLGRLLNDHEWGIYGLAMSAATIVGTIRDGGVRQILIQRPNEYDSLIGPVFWLSLVCNLVAGMLLAAAAIPIADAWGEPQAAPLIWIIAASFPLGTPGVVLQARLAIQLRFREVGVIQSASGVVRFGGAMTLALMGVGPMAFVLPLIGCAILEWAMAWYFVREPLWSRPPQAARWRALLAGTLWIMLGSAAIALLNWGGSLAIKPFVPTETVGVYFFAFQIIVQVGILLSSNLNAVLFPAMSRIAGEPERLAAAAARSLRQVMLIAAPLSAGLAVTFPSLEAIFFAGKKANSINAVLIQGATYAFAVMLAVPLSVQQARGRFRSWAIGLTGTSLAGVTAAATGAWLHKSAEGIALWSGAATAITGLAYALFTLKRIGVPRRTSLASSLPAWGISLASGGLAWALDQRLATNPISLDTLPLPAPWLAPAAVTLRFLLVGAAFSILFAILARVFLSDHVRDAVGILPARIRPLFERLMRTRSANT